MKASGLTQRMARCLVCGLAALVLLVGASSTAQAQLGLEYLFVTGVDDPTVVGGIIDVSGNAHYGSVINSAYAELTMGPSGHMNAIHIDPVNTPDATDGAGIDTGIQTDNPDVNFFNGPFTAMAWVNLDDINGDHMVFGSTAPNAPGSGEPRAGSLHMGFRNNQVYFGFWGGSVNRDTNSPGGEVLPFAWHHVVWRFTGSGGPGSQDIFVDGKMVVNHPGAPNLGGLLAENNNVPNVPAEVLIGRTVANNGAFAGSLADVRIYRVALPDNVIAAIAGSSP